MKLLLTKSLTHQSRPANDGVFAGTGDKLMFFYNDGSGIRGVSLEQERLDVVSDRTVPLPRNWSVVSQQDRSYLVCCEEVAFDLEELVPVDPVPQQIIRGHRRNLEERNWHMPGKIYDLGSYQIHHRKEWQLVCQKEDRDLWQFRTHSYLYTDICAWQDRVYFGTSGRGGYFYVLDLPTGRPLLQLSTGGTRRICQVGADCYILVGGKKPRLVRIHLPTGQITDSLDLPGQIRDYHNVLHQEGDRLYALTWQYQKIAMSTTGRKADVMCQCLLHKVQTENDP